VKTSSAWEDVQKGKHNLVYISPEMALSVSFRRLWRTQAFRSKVAAIVVDEVHCIEQWGAEFRKTYEELATLRVYVGHDVPFVSCSATITTHTFDVTWRSLQYGYRPMWGIDVGCSRPELSYIIRELDEQVTPAKQIWDLLPFLREANDHTPVSSLQKTILYLPTKLACRKAKRMLREHLPKHLGHTVQSFTAIASSEAKEITFRQFSRGEIRILCATEAAGMGCNVKDIEVVVVVGNGLKSLSVLVQRWGRAARSFGMLGTCILLMPKWAWEPLPPNPILSSQLKGRGGKESKRFRESREGLQYALKGLVNLKNGE
jgi:superfamily II DNA helicase RecQ